ncbi:MAG: hypothetical protein JWM11_5361 [Planctomycetaceae bacterium]|nr:hypothetical protein [Planctomycetaceae bacterium]
MQFARWISKSWCLALLLSGFASTNSLQADDQRFQAEFADGSRISGDELRNWHDTAAQPVLTNKPLFDQSNPARWVIDTSLKVTPSPEAFVEFMGGDRLPGIVVGASTGTDSRFQRMPPHLILERQAWNFPGLPSPTPLRVTTRWIRRVVWQRRSAEKFEPGTLFYQDGRRITFRAVRWAAASVMLLLDQATSEVAFHDIAEIHLPQTDVWGAYIEQLAFLCPGGTKPLFQWETQQGLRVTGSFERFQGRPHGNQNDPNAWWHLVQPAWSLDPLWVSHRMIRTRRFFEPHVVPLTLLEPVRSTHVAGLGGGWNWVRDRNVQAGPLQSGGNEFGWGMGVQAHHELEYALPRGSLTFRTRIGLDRCIGTGGCARGKIFLTGNQNQPVFQTELLIGSGSVADSGQLNVAGQPGLILTADSADAERPAGADPFDIRDSLDWLEPELRLDPTVLQSQIRAAVSKLVPCWESWTVTDAETGPFLFKNRWSTIDSRDPRYISEINSRVPFLTISKSLKLGAQQKFLVLAASRFPEGTTPAHLQVRINGQSIGDFEVPVRQGAIDPDPILVPLDEFRGKDVQLEISHMAGGPQALVDWNAVLFFDRRPGLLALFEDDEKLLDRLREGSGQAEIDRADAYTGSAALRVVKGEAGNAFLFNEPLKIRESPKLGEYRFLRFVWRKKQGTPVCLQLASDGRFGEEKTPIERQTFRYDAGQGERSHGGARRMEDRLPTEWVVVTRDLVGDWGDFNLTGLSFGTPDDQPAWLDHVYLARSWQELDKIQVEPHSSRKKK